MPPITLALIVMNLAVYALMIATGPDIVRIFGLWPPGSGGRLHVWQLVTYAFLHGSPLHLGLNLFALWMFGAGLERRWNELRYLLTFLLSVIVAGMTQIVVSGYFLQASGPVIGASGGVFGLLLAYALYFPNRVVSLFSCLFSAPHTHVRDPLRRLRTCSGRDQHQRRCRTLRPSGRPVRWLAGGSVFSRAGSVRPMASGLKAIHESK